MFFTNSGTEAWEGAMKFARRIGKEQGRIEYVVFEHSFHGRTMGALSTTWTPKYREPFEPLVPGVRFLPRGDLGAVAGAVGDRTAAVMIEPVQGEGGIRPAAPEFLKGLQAICRDRGALLVFDEIQCGLGRTGSMFVFQELGVRPDLVALAKPLGGGLPLGALLVGPALQDLVKPGHHGTTFGGNPVACRLGLECLDEIERVLLPRVRDLGTFFGKALGRARRRTKSIVDVRGRGLMWGVELDREASPVQKSLLEKGFVVGTARQRVLRLLPPYVVPKAALSGFVNALEETLKETQP